MPKSLSAGCYPQILLRWNMKQIESPNLSEVSASDAYHMCHQMYNVPTTCKMTPTHLNIFEHSRPTQVQVLYSMKLSLYETQMIRAQIFEKYLLKFFSSYNIYSIQKLKQKICLYLSSVWHFSLLDWAADQFCARQYQIWFVIHIERYHLFNLF